MQTHGSCNLSFLVCIFAVPYFIILGVMVIILGLIGIVLGVLGTILVVMGIILWTLGIIFWLLGTTIVIDKTMLNLN